MALTGYNSSSGSNPGRLVQTSEAVVNDTTRVSIRSMLLRRIFRPRFASSSAF